MRVNVSSHDPHPSQENPDRGPAGSDDWIADDTPEERDTAWVYLILVAVMTAIAVVIVACSRM